MWVHLSPCIATPMKLPEKQQYETNHNRINFQLIFFELYSDILLKIDSSWMFAT